MDESEELKFNKTGRINVRVTLFEKAVLKVKASECGLNISEYLIRCGTNRNLPRSLTIEELEALKEIQKFQANFTRMSNFIQKYNDEALKLEVKILLEEVKQFQKHMKW